MRGHWHSLKLGNSRGVSRLRPVIDALMKLSLNHNKKLAVKAALAAVASAAKDDVEAMAAVQQQLEHAEAMPGDSTGHISELRPPEAFPVFKTEVGDKLLPSKAGDSEAAKVKSGNSEAANGK